MKSSMFHFGAGARTCIGRNVSLMETYKLVPSFLTKFEVSFLPPGSAIDETNTWIALGRGIRGTEVLGERVLCGAEELQSASETSTWGF
jgi:hypothetical protein